MKAKQKIRHGLPPAADASERRVHLQNHYSTQKDRCTGMVICYGLENHGPEMKKGGTLKAIIAALAFLAILAGAFFVGRALAEDVQTVYVMMKTGDYVNVRTGPGKRYQKLGYLETGDDIQTDGKTRNGWLHIVNLNMEAEEGWIYAGYTVDEKPEQLTGESFRIDAPGRVACRKWVNGPRRAWAKKGSTVTVYAIGGEWALTNRGYIRAEYLEVTEP